ncbi:MAG: hypothetical protein WBD47_15395 [Phormidesmis sp.]
MQSKDEKTADWFPVAKLFARYELAKTTVYTRMKGLNITAKRVGIRSYVSHAQLALLDDLHECIKEGGNIAEFRLLKHPKKLAEASSSTANPSTIGSVELSSGIVLDQADIWKLIRAIASEI